jgi:stage II sporulation SpoAA-like protein
MQRSSGQTGDASVSMSISVHHEQDNIYRLDVQGLLQKRDLERSQEVLVTEMQRIGNVRLLFILSGFEGWDQRDDWRDMSFYVKYGSSIDRIAIVGDERWQAETMMFTGAGLRKAAVEFFPEASVAQARAWLSA